MERSFLRVHLDFSNGPRSASNPGKPTAPRQAHQHKTNTSKQGCVCGCIAWGKSSLSENTGSFQKSAALVNAAGEAGLKAFCQLSGGWVQSRQEACYDFLEVGLYDFGQGRTRGGTHRRARGAAPRPQEPKKLEEGTEPRQKRPPNPKGKPFCCIARGKVHHSLSDGGSR